jgi:hypothetical protein
MVDTDYIVRSGFIVTFILIHLVMLIFKPLLTLLLILIYIIVIGGDLFLTLRKFKGGVTLEIIDVDIIPSEETLIVSFGMEGPTGGYIPKNYSLDLGIFDGEELVAELTHLAPAGKSTVVELEVDRYIKWDLSGKTLTIAGEVTPMILFIPIPYNKLPEDNFAHVEITFPDQNFVIEGKAAVEEAVEEVVVEDE